MIYTTEMRRGSVGKYIFSWLCAKYKISKLPFESSETVRLCDSVEFGAICIKGNQLACSFTLNLKTLSRTHVMNDLFRHATPQQFALQVNVDLRLAADLHGLQPEHNVLLLI